MAKTDKIKYTENISIAIKVVE